MMRKQAPSKFFARFSPDEQKNFLTMGQFKREKLWRMSMEELRFCLNYWQDRIRTRIDAVRHVRAIELEIASRSITQSADQASPVKPTAAGASIAEQR